MTNMDTLMSWFNSANARFIPRIPGIIFQNRFLFEGCATFCNTEVNDTRKISSKYSAPDTRQVTDSEVAWDIYKQKITDQFAQELWYSGPYHINDMLHFLENWQCHHSQSYMDSLWQPWTLCHSTEMYNRSSCVPFYHIPSLMYL